MLVALFAILQSTLYKVIGRQFDEFLLWYKCNDASSLEGGKLICFKSLIEAFDEVMS